MPTDIRQHVCRHCGEQLVRKRNERPSRFAERQFCGQACSAAFGHARLRTEGRLEDLLMLLEAGESAYHIPARLGTTPGALSLWLRRNRHPQLATLFENVTRAA
jgi:hypothetical protein